MPKSIWPELSKWLNGNDRKIDHQKLIDEILSERESFICRIGCMEVQVCKNPRNIVAASRHIGVSPPTLEETQLFTALYMKSIQSATMIGEWRGKWFNIEPWFLNQNANPLSKRIMAETLGDAEYFINPSTKNSSWFYRALNNKKVLIIHAFSMTMKQQYEKHVFDYPSFESIIFYTAINSQREPYEVPEHTWSQNLKKMKEEISKLDFEIALIGCGSYSLPLGYFIMHDMKKKAVVMGGALQLYFAIRGHRWDVHPDYPHLQKYFDSKWVRPHESEKPSNWKKIENGAYW